MQSLSHITVLSSSRPPPQLAHNPTSSPLSCRHPEAAHQDSAPGGAAAPHCPPSLHKELGCGHHQHHCWAWTCRYDCCCCCRMQVMFCLCDWSGSCCTCICVQFWGQGWIVPLLPLPLKPNCALCCTALICFADVGRSYLRVFDDATFDLLASYQLGPNEIPNAVASMAFGGSNGGSSSDAAAAAMGAASSSIAAASALGSSREEEPPQFFIVGTAIIKPNVRLDNAWSSHCTLEPTAHQGSFLGINARCDKGLSLWVACASTVEACLHTSSAAWC